MSYERMLIYNPKVSAWHTMVWYHTQIPELVQTLLQTPQHHYIIVYPS